MSNLIERQAAIDMKFSHGITEDGLLYVPYREVKTNLEELPSAQPDIITCKDCKYSDENWRRVSVRWLPCMDMRTGSNWFCGSAERRTNDEG